MKGWFCVDTKIKSRHTANAVLTLYSKKSPHFQRWRDELPETNLTAVAGGEKPVSPT